MEKSINEYSVASDEESVSSSLKTPNSVCTSRNPSSDLDEHEFISTANEEKLAEEQKQWVKEGPQTAKSTNPKKYFCTECDRGFTTFGNMRRHQQIAHGGRKQFKCEICDKEFVENQSLQVHIKCVHLGIKEFECAFCGKTCGTKSALKSHVLKVHGNSKLIVKKTVKCYICDATFHHSGNLKRHINNFHQNIFNWKCETCGKKLKSKQSLQLHIRTQHSTSKQYPCELCYSERLLAAGSSISPIQETVFTTKGGLLNHLSSAAHKDNPRLHEAVAKVTAGGANVKVEFLEKMVEDSVVPSHFSDTSSARAGKTISPRMDKQEWWCELCYGFIDSNDFPDKAIVSLFKNKNSLLSHLNSIAHRNDPRLPAILKKIALRSNSEIKSNQSIDFSKKSLDSKRKKPVIHDRVEESMEICVKEEPSEENCEIEVVTVKEEIIDEDDLPLTKAVALTKDTCQTHQTVDSPKVPKVFLDCRLPKVRVKLADSSILSKIKFKPLSILGTSGPMVIRPQPTTEEIVVKEENVSDDDDFFVQN